MKFYLMDKQIYTDADKMAWIELGDHDLLCIGTEAEIRHADVNKICELICVALAWHRFALISTATGMTKH